MTELALILGIQVVALAYAWVVGRSLFLTRALPNRLARLGSALERAAELLAMRQATHLLAGVAVFAVGLAILHGTAENDPGFRRPAVVLTSVVGLALGAGLTWLATRVSLRLGLRSGVQTPAAALERMDSVLRTSVRSGAAAAFTLEAAMALGLMLAFGTVFALLGGTVLEPREALRLALSITQKLASFPLGCALAALIFQRSGGTFQTAAELGAGVSSELKFGLARDDPRSPALVSEITGEHVGESATRCALACVAAGTSQLALLALGLCAARLDPSPRIGLVLLPFVVRAFFLLASGFGVAVVRTEEMTSPSAGLLRGYVCCLLVGLTGVAGSCFWLAREQFAALCSCGVIGALSATLAAVAAWVRLARSAPSARETADALRTGGASAALLGLGSGLQTALLPLVVLGLGSALCWKIGAGSGLVAGGVRGLLLGWAALLGATPFAFAANAVGSVARSARGVSALGQLEPEASRRAARMEETLPTAAAARALLITASGGSALLAAFAIPALAHGELRLGLNVLEPAVTWSGALGVAILLAYAGSCARGAIRAGLEVALEVDRQLRRFQRDRGVTQLPADFSPSYRACVDLASRGALSDLVWHVASALVAPACLTLGLWAWYRGSESPRTSEALTSFVLLTTISGLAAALALDFARATLSAARRATRAATSADALFAPTADGFGEVLGFSAAPATQALLASVAAFALALAPFVK